MKFNCLAEFSSKKLNADLQLQTDFAFIQHQRGLFATLLSGLASELVSKFYINEINLRTIESL